MSHFWQVFLYPQLMFSRLKPVLLFFYLFLLEMGRNKSCPDDYKEDGGMYGQTGPRPRGGSTNKDQKLNQWKAGMFNSIQNIFFFF